MNRQDAKGAKICEKLGLSPTGGSRVAATSPVPAEGAKSTTSHGRQVLNRRDAESFGMTAPERGGFS
jgi:hypothetical protein